MLFFNPGQVIEVAVYSCSDMFQTIYAEIHSGHPVMLLGSEFAIELDWENVAVPAPSPFSTPADWECQYAVVIQ